MADEEVLSPTGMVVSRVRDLRKKRGWTAERLASEMQRAGAPWQRVVVSKLETGKRRTVTVEELLALAQVLDVPPMHLLLPTEDEHGPRQPSWMLNLVSAVEEYEERHGHPNDGWDCLRAALLPVPERVRNLAAGYGQAKREAASATSGAED